MFQDASPSCFLGCYSLKSDVKEKNNKTLPFLSNAIFDKHILTFGDTMWREIQCCMLVLTIKKVKLTISTALSMPQCLVSCLR